ncbi:MAG: SufD family Fe-S cluster assembly protein [Opitutales bacterium]
MPPTLATEVPAPAAPPVAADPLLESAFAAALDHSGEPAWLADRRRAAWREFSTRAIPVRKDERWRFATLQGLSLDGFHLPSAAPAGPLAADLKSRSALVPAVAQLTFADDHLLDRSPLPAELARQGVIFLPLAEAIARHPDLLREHLFANDRALGGEKFLGLHQAHTRAGAFLYVPAGVEIPATFVAAHWAATPGAALFPHTLIVAGANSIVNFLDYYDSAAPAGSALVIGSATVLAGPGAKVFRKSIQNLNTESLSFQMDTALGERDADVKSIGVHLGARRARVESQARLVGPGARLRLYGLTIGRGAQEFDQRTFQDHVAPRATSDLLFKNALLDDARSIFAGMIRVEPAAEETDAYQQNRNLLLGPAAEANSLPGLEIMNCNVRCTHGATTGRVDPAQLFYLRSRGIPRAIAYQLLVFGFFEEVIEKVENAPLADLLHALVRQKFEK